MARANGLTYNEFMALAMQSYDHGGDSYVECWDERTFDEYVAQFGQITKAKALKMFRENLDEENDMMGRGF